MVAGDGPGPEELAQARELEKALEAALMKLPPEQREVFWLKEKSGLTMAEIADMTGVSQNTVKSRLRYALEKLRADLAAQGFRP
jgi:RNA polymerase sigma-70 factor (ECF subfamily)